MDEVRPVIEQFAGRMFGGFARRDQRAKGELYLRGLMLDGKRKSMQPMAERLGVDHQQLQQFVTTSTWDPHRGPAAPGRMGQRVHRPRRAGHR